MPNRVSVLLVDDSSAFLRIAERFLEESPEVRVAGAALGGLQALPLARDLQPDVVVVDLQMPDLSGLKLIPRLRTALPEVRIIALTLHDNEAYRQAARGRRRTRLRRKSRHGHRLAASHTKRCET